AILSSVIVFFSRFEFASEPYQKIDGGHPLRETFLHHPVGHDLVRIEKLPNPALSLMIHTG
ncbi:hypothetical protein, partial [Sphingobium cupriresistens]|uniref:hypothetical protein n=1 Tax=Sphingobium cupriresistens TaxID=1132417 RepID=UPI001A910AD1